MAFTRQILIETEDSTEETREKPPAKCERPSGELLGLTRGCDLRKEGVTVTFAQAHNPNNLDYRCLSLGLSHLTVIRTHILLDHLLSSVEVIIKLKREVVNNFFRVATCNLAIAS